jgi:GABA permease
MAGAFELVWRVDSPRRGGYYVQEDERSEMRNPVRSETDAFFIAVGGAALIAASLALGSLVDPLVGVALLVGAVIGAFVWEVSTKDPDRRRPFQEAASQARRLGAGTGARVLVVANRTLHGDELRAELRRRAVTGAEFHIVAPVLSSRAHYIASDVDTELAEARNRLATVLAWAEAEGVAVTGKVGDANAALGAIEDELRRYGADEVIISTYPPGRSNWLETGIVERLRDELDIPVTHVVVQPDRVPQIAGQ